MTAAHVWRGQHGTVALGDTQHRVALYLDHATRHGWVQLTTAAIAERLNLERSEAYRITSRLRALGLFGVTNDRGGHEGGRRWWRTPTAGVPGRLDAVRHRLAWARVVAGTRARARARLEHYRRSAPVPPAGADPTTRADATPIGSGSFADLMRAAGLGRLMDEWKVRP
jgi:hypothetical protein